MHDTRTDCDDVEGAEQSAPPADWRAEFLIAALGGALFSTDDTQTGAD